MDAVQRIQGKCGLFRKSAGERMILHLGDMTVPVVIFIFAAAREVDAILVHVAVIHVSTDDHDRECQALLVKELVHLRKRVRRVGE